MMRDRKTVLDLTGADCPSCVYAIERAGKKIQGVRDIRVDPVQHEIHVTYEADSEAPREIIAIVQRLGYDATPRHQEPNEV